MTKTVLPDQKTIKLTPTNQRIESGQSLPPGTVILPMKVLEKPEKVSKRNARR